GILSSKKTKQEEKTRHGRLNLVNFHDFLSIGSSTLWANPFSFVQSPVNEVLPICRGALIRIKLPGCKIS
ncbi:hypothetical protein, partial [Coleofasciculus chthonoplastes]|uniref:hypothetical protein n=1 Tax=Coleofasciculus chthonoplastes TaxID=64178 RepID=UPI0032F7A6FD